MYFYIYKNVKSKILIFTIQPQNTINYYYTMMTNTINVKYIIIRKKKITFYLFFVKQNIKSQIIIFNVKIKIILPL